MTVLVDASALVAIVLDEPERDEILERLGADAERLIIPLGIWEAALAVSRVLALSPTEADREVGRFLSDLDIRPVGLPDQVGSLALEAHERFGQGRHPAKLNFGDCFAYACAKLWGAKLLYKGDDFAQTDIEAA